MSSPLVFLEEAPAGIDTFRDRAKAAFVIHLVALATGVPAAEIARETRARTPAARARWLAMYLLHTALAVPVMRVAATFGRDRTTVGQVMGRIEDRRTDADFDHLVGTLERCALAAPVELEARALDLFERPAGSERRS